jgi:hypothetical protein
MKRFASLAGAAVLACLTVACAQTDAGVTSKVKAQLAADDLVKAHSVDVDTREHIVTLRGDVVNEAARQQAIRIARNTEGVEDVVDELRIVGTSGTIDDSGDSTDRRIEIKVPDDKVEITTDDKKDDSVTIKTDDNLGDDVKDGTKATGNAIKKGAEATADGAKKVGGAIRDAVTDDDKDSDNDGK